VTSSLPSKKLTSSAEPPPSAAAEPPSTAVADEEEPPKKDGDSSWTKQLVLGAVLALVGAVIGRAVGVIPNPFRGVGPEPSGSIEIGETIRNQTRAMFLGTATVPEPNAQFGLTLAVQRTSEHTSPGTCKIVWSYIDPSVPTTVGEKNLVDQTARDVKGEPNACEGGARIWVPLAPSLETYGVVRVRVELFAGDKQLGIPAETADIPL
jgi:hypothetical protein